MGANKLMELTNLMSATSVTTTMMVMVMSTPMATAMPSSTTSNYYNIPTVLPTLDHIQYKYY